jgi:hypothetical protein
MTTITTKSNNVFIDKVITCGGLNVKYRLYAKLTPQLDTQASEDESDEDSEKFNYSNKIVLEGAYGSGVRLYWQRESADLDDVNHAIKVKDAIQSFLKTKKYNKIILKNGSDPSGSTVNLRFDSDYSYFEDVKKAHLGPMLEVLKAFCPVK